MNKTDDGSWSIIGAIVLAAGSSTRMGAHNKLLLKVYERSVVAHSIDVLRTAHIAPILIVTGHDASALQACILEECGATTKDDLEFVHNPNHEEGMASSIRCGAAAIAPRCDAFFICLADMPQLRAQTLHMLKSAHTSSPHISITRPMHNNTFGHPVLFDRKHAKAMQKLRGDIGARSIVQEHTDTLCILKVNDPGVSFDVDTPLCFSHLKA